MVKKPTREPRVSKPKKTLHRCLVENSVVAPAHEYGRRFGPGQVVDLEESIGDGLKLRDVVRDGCFEEIDVTPLDQSEETNGDTDRS